MDIKPVVFSFLYNDPLMLWTEFRKLLVIAQQIEGIYGALEKLWELLLAPIWWQTIFWTSDGLF